MPRKAPPDDELQRFRERLARAMRALGITRAELGKRLGGKSSQYVSQLLTGATNPSRRSIAGVENALGLGVGYLTRPEQDPCEELIGPQRVLAPDLARWRERLEDARRLRAAGHIAAARDVVDELLRQMEEPRTLSESIDRLRAEALLLRSELHHYLASWALTMADAKAARELAFPLRESDPSLFARAYFRHICWTQWAPGPPNLVEVCTAQFPPGLGPDEAFLPLVADLLTRPDEVLQPEAAEALRLAIEPARFGPEKTAGYFILESQTADGERYCTEWVAEAMASGDPIELSRALRHAALRALKRAPRLRAYHILLESTELAVLHGYGHGVQESADAWAQILGPFAMDTLAAEGVDLASFGADVVTPAVQMCAEVIGGDGWIDQARAFSSQARVVGLALLGHEEEMPGAAEQLLAWEEPCLGSDRVGWVLAVAAITLSRRGAARPADAMWAMTDEALRRAMQSGAAQHLIPQIALLMHEAGRAPELVADALHEATRRHPTSAWDWALRARALLDPARPLAALGPAERAWQLLDVLPEAQAVYPLPTWRLQTERRERLTAAVRETLSWILPAFAAAAESPHLSAARRAASRRAAARIRERLDQTGV